MHREGDARTFCALRVPRRSGSRSGSLLYSPNYDGEPEGTSPNWWRSRLTWRQSGAAVRLRCTAEFATFIRSPAYEPDTFYIAFRDETVDSIRDAAALRHAQTIVDTASAGPLIAILPGFRRGHPRVPPACAGLSKAPPGLSLRPSSGLYALFRSWSTSGAPSRGSAS